MSKPNNAFEVFQFLDKSNCGECGVKTCLAFAGAVFLGQKRVRECPKLSPGILERFREETDAKGSHEPSPEDRLEKLKSQVAQIDLAKAAERVGAVYSGNKLSIKVLGKDFSVDEKGNLTTEIHVNPWVAVPFLSYILHGQGLPPAGKWVP